MINHFQIRFFYNIEKVLKCKYEKWRSKMYIIIFIFGVQCVPKNIKIFQTTNWKPIWRFLLNFSPLLINLINEKKKKVIMNSVCVCSKKVTSNRETSQSGRVARLTGACESGCLSVRRWRNGVRVLGYPIKPEMKTVVWMQL
jgi:hypothetical protein